MGFLGGSLLRRGFLGCGLLGRSGLLALALAAADLALLARHVAVAVEIVEVFAVIHLDAGVGDLIRLALGLPRLLPRGRPDVAALDVVHQVVVTLDSSSRNLLTHNFEPSLGVAGFRDTLSEWPDKLRINFIENVVGTQRDLRRGTPGGWRPGAFSTENDCG